MVLGMQKIQRLDKLSKKEQEELVYDLVHAVSTANSVGEAALFLQDILTQREMKNLSKRLRIAKLLLAGMTYEQIEQSLHVSHGTVAKVAFWLTEKGDGFRKVIKRLPQKDVEKKWFERSEWDNIKRRYSIYFWPELLREEVIKSANKRQKERIKETIDNLEEKTEQHKRIEQMLKI